MTLETFDQLSNVAEFFAENFELRADVAHKAQNFYSVYRDWCFLNGYKPVGKIQCFNALRELKNLRIEPLPRKQNQQFIWGIKAFSASIDNFNQIALLPEECNPDGQGSSENVIEHQFAEEVLDKSSMLFENGIASAHLVNSVLNY
jgi:hypothetical protein